MDVNPRISVALWLIFSIDNFASWLVGLRYDGFEALVSSQRVLVAVVLC